MRWLLAYILAFTSFVTQTESRSGPWHNELILHCEAHFLTERMARLNVREGLSSNLYGPASATTLKPCRLHIVGFEEEQESCSTIFT